MSLTAVDGFGAGGLASGIKASGAPDLAIVATTDGAPVTAAGVFTSNLVAAAPVQISRRHLADGRAAAVVLSSGNANAATGEQGRADALRMCELTAQAVGCATTDVLVCPTGLIGIPMPMDPVESGIPKLGAQLTTDAAAGLAAADALLTTDTVRKLTHQPVELPAHGGPRPSAAWPRARRCWRRRWPRCSRCSPPTSRSQPAPLHARSQTAVDTTFNALVVDACKSTNDTVLVLANGEAGNEPITTTSGFAYAGFVEALTAACADLAHQMATDAEGATKCVTLTVRGARNPAEAQPAARTVARASSCSARSTARTRTGAGSSPSSA